MLRDEVDDVAEFNMHINNLGLDASLKEGKVFTKPDALLQFEEIDEQIFFAIVNISRLDKTIQEQIDEYAQSAKTIDLPDLGADGAKDEEMKSDEDMIAMPNNLHLLTTYFSFNFVELPPDFH